MDLSIMKLLEEDEDETMHSGADVEAFQAALNRDIGGDASTSRPSSSHKGVSQGDNHMPSQSYPGWQPTSQAEIANSQIQQEQKNAEHQEQMLAQMQRQQGDSLADPQQNKTLEEVNHQHLKQKQVQDGHQLEQGEQNSLQIKQSPGMPVSENNSLPVSEPGRVQTLDSESQYLKLQQMSNQQATIPGQAPNKANCIKQVPFALLLPVILPQLDKDRAMQLQTLFFFGDPGNPCALLRGGVNPGEARGETTTHAPRVNRAIASPGNRTSPLALGGEVRHQRGHRTGGLQLQTLYAKLKKNEIPDDGFVRIMRGIVGDQMLKLAVMKMQTQPPPQLHVQGQTSALPQHPRMQPASAANSTIHLHQAKSIPQWIEMVQRLERWKGYQILMTKCSCLPSNSLDLF